MTMQATSTMGGLKQTVGEALSQQPILLSEPGIVLRLASSQHAHAMSANYRAAYNRGDYFAGRYESPNDQIFDPNWLRQDLDNPDHLWFTFTDRDGLVLGSTGYFHDGDSQSGPLMNSDETQISRAGRGKRIMDAFFQRVVPLIEQSGMGLAADFVLTPETKGLRRSLQSELGMVALGIHPQILQHPELPVSRSEISAVKYASILPKPVNILPEFAPLYRIVQRQIPSLPEPTVVAGQSASTEANFGPKYLELDEPVSAQDVDAQRQALACGFRPVAFDPDKNVYRMAQLPAEQPELDFIFTNERVAANQSLVRYMCEVLYSQSAKVESKGGNNG